MTVLLVDANNVAMRAVHAMARSGLTDDHGVATGPLLNFITTLSKHVKEEQPRAVAVCWDGGRSRRRVDLSPEYKAHRLDAPEHVESVKQDVFSLAKEFCTVAGIHHVERTGYEADDLIAHYWRQRNPGERTVILSSDKDFLQLVEGNTEQVRLSSAGTPTDRWTQARIIEEMGCHPGYLNLALALAGDVSDNVIGVPRVGMKTAIKIIARHAQDATEFAGPITDIQSIESRVLGDPKIEPYADRVRTNLALVDLRNPYGDAVPLPAIPSFQPTTPGSVMYESFLSFLDRHQMKSVQSRFYARTLWN